MNIEEFVNDYLQEHRHEVLLNPYNGLVEFAKVFQEKLMKEAVEGEVYLYHSYNRNATAIVVDIPKENLGENVRIIIVKED